MTAATISLEERAVYWCTSPEGRAAIEQAMKDAAAVTKRFNDAIRVPWWRLMEPMTI